MAAGKKRDFARSNSSARQRTTVLQDCRRVIPELSHEDSPAKTPRLPHCLGRHQRDHPANERALVRATRCTPPRRRARRHLPPARVARPPSLATVDASSRIRRRGGDPSRVAPPAPSSDPAGPWFSPPPRTSPPSPSPTPSARRWRAWRRPATPSSAWSSSPNRVGWTSLLAQEPRGVHVRANDRHGRHPRPNPSPASPRDSPSPPGCVSARPAASDTRRSRRMSADSRSPPCARRPCAPTSASAGTATPAPPPS